MRQTPFKERFGRIVKSAITTILGNISIRWQLSGRTSSRLIKIEPQTPGS